MDIRVNNLDLGYDQCEGLNNLAKQKGQDLINELKNNINNLKVHWVGNDAMVHINNLIELYGFLGKLVDSAMSVTSNAANSMIRLQEIRQANGGMGSVGAALNSFYEYGAIPNVISTTEYYVEPAALNDLSTLKNIYSSYKEFITNFNSKKDELFSNWTMGANIENAKARFEEFSNVSSKYDSYLVNAIENLSKACNNISRA